MISGDYGLYVWPSSIVLAHYIWTNRGRLSGKTFLEVIPFFSFNVADIMITAGCLLAAIYSLKLIRKNY